MGWVRVKSVGLALLIGSASFGGSAGCDRWKSWDYDQKKLGRPGVYSGPANPPEVTQSAMTDRQLRNVPTVVEGAFRQEHPDAAVTNVAQRTDGTGRMLYEVSFIEDGTAGRVLYQDNGADLTAPPRSVIRMDDPDDYRPRLPATPATRPADSVSAREPT